MIGMLLNNPIVLQRAANAAAVSTISGAAAASRAASLSHSQAQLHIHCRGRQQKQQLCKITPTSVVTHCWKSFLHNNNGGNDFVISRTNAGTQKLRPTEVRRSQAKALNAYAIPVGSSPSSSLPSTSVTSIQSFAPYSSQAMPSKCLELNNINPNYIVMQYAVRGPLVIRAGEIEKELERGVKKPFDRVIRANIGDCHAMGQQPITFLRQLLALTFEPRLLDSPDYPSDVKQRARELLNGCPGCSVGSYTDSAGLEIVRRQVAEFIKNRDGGVPADWQNIYLTGGASPGIKSIIALINAEVSGKTAGVMVPIPQYPLYSATLSEFGLEKVDYYLEEETGWSMSRKELQRAYDESKTRCNPRALVVINPGNPTGQVLTRENIEEIIKFAHDNNLVILADEVYQANVYDKNSKFYSFKKIMHEMGEPYRSQELVSFLSISKGFLGECGIRGGYMEVVNMCPEVKAVLTKSITASLCSTTAGQLAVSALVNPPKPGEPSYEKFNAEKNAVLAALKERAELVHKTMSSFEGYKVNPVQGAMYVFPQIEIPPKAIEAAKKKNLAPDAFYAFELLETSGICIVPGSGFGQKPGTYHFRSTILPQTELLKEMMEKFRKFHAQFMKKYK